MSTHRSFMGWATPPFVQYTPGPRNKGVAMWLVCSLMGVVENCPVECLSMLQTLKESWLYVACR
jgi:hypothetical protein